LASRAVPALEKQLAALLKLAPEVPTAELSAHEWADREVVVDELATFFPLTRYFDREWASVKTSLADQLERGKLVLVRGISAEARPHLGLLLDYSASALGPDSKVKGRIVWVLEAYDEASLKGQEKVHPVTRLDVGEQPQHEEGAYKLQVSGKRNHTFYVNLALKVLARRPWYSSIELSGLGNAIPSIVSIAEILKRYKVAVIERIETSLVELTDEGRKTQKAKATVLLKKVASTPVIPDDDSEQTI